MGEIAALGAAALWAVASAMFASVGRATSVVVLNLWKTAIGLGLMAVTLLVIDGRLWPEGLSQTDLGWLVVSGVIGLTVGDSAYFGALMRIGPRRALLLWALIPPVTALGAIPVLGEPLTAGMLAGIALTGAGVTWVLVERTPGEAGPERLDPWGVVFGLLAVACQCGGSLTAKFGGRGLDALELSVVRLTAGAVGCVIVAAAQGRAAAAVALLRSRPQMTTIVSATFLATYLGIWLSMLALQNTLAGIAATLTSTSPIFVLPIARFWLKEQVSLRAIVGAFIAVAGVAILVMQG